MSLDMDEDYVYLDEESVKKIITDLLNEIEKLKDENESLWFLLEELEQSNLDGAKAVEESIKNLKFHKAMLNKAPAEA
jgi:hypothetical protein